jgi:hypothetical protein
VTTILAMQVIGNPQIENGALVDFYEREYRDGVRPHLTVAR